MADHPNGPQDAACDNPACYKCTPGPPCKCHDDGLPAVPFAGDPDDPDNLRDPAYGDPPADGKPDKPPAPDRHPPPTTHRLGYPADLDANRGQYPGPEQLGLMVLAIRDGITATATAHNMSRRTLTSWFDRFGNGTLGRVREWLQAETLGAFLRVEQDIYREVSRRLPDMPNDELGMTLRALVNARALVPAQATATQPAPIAAAQATVTLQVTETDGKVSVIELGTPPEDDSAQELP